MLWINKSRTDNMMLLKLIGSENTVKIAPFVFFFFFGGEPNVWQKKNEKNDVICSGQAYLSHGSIFGYK